MNLKEFMLHRPLLGKQLLHVLKDEDFVGAWEHGWIITPHYDDEVRFIAKHLRIGILICVGPNHPASMVEENTPGCTGTWIWKDDLDEMLRNQTS